MGYPVQVLCGGCRDRQARRGFVSCHLQPHVSPTKSLSRPPGLPNEYGFQPPTIGEVTPRKPSDTKTRPFSRVGLIDLNSSCVGLAKADGRTYGNFRTRGGARNRASTSWMPYPRHTRTISQTITTVASSSWPAETGKTYTSLLITEQLLNGKGLVTVHGSVHRPVGAIAQRMVGRREGNP